MRTVPCVRYRHNPPPYMGESALMRACRAWFFECPQEHLRALRRFHPRYPLIVGGRHV